jgi:hypothetical protein
MKVMLESQRAGDADPGTLLRRRRREVALFCYYDIRKIVPLLDDNPTLTLRCPYKHLTNHSFTGELYEQWLCNSS